MSGFKTVDAREQLFNFLSMSSDIARNQRDADFADRGGQIIYCFDSTVFSLFFDTVQWRSAVSSFYGKEWADSDTTQRWQRIEAQSALIASEYLLSEDLPGAKNRNIYLTPWHRTELAITADKLSASYRNGTYNKTDIEHEIRRKLRLLDVSRKIQNSEREITTGRDPDLVADLENLKPHYENGRKLARYEVTRRAAATLVQCEKSERLDQLHRLVSSPLRQRIKPLHSLFDPADEDVESLRRSAEEFFEYLQSEVVKRDRLNPRRRGRDRDRSPLAIWNDAQSLAYLRWVSAQVRSDQRVVLVTSDDVLFDAYRRWWADRGIERDGSSQEFLLRRSFQYTPIFNLRDASNDISKNERLRDEVQKLFFRIKEAIYTVLIPFNLVQIGERNRDLVELAQNRQFEYMAMRAKDYRSSENDIVIEHYMSQLDTAWYEKQSTAIDDIADLWREIERIGIGFFYEQVLKRLEDDDDLYGTGATDLEYEEIGDEAVAYLARSLDLITDKTRQAYLPIAESYLRQQILNVGGQSQRAPETIWYKLPNGKSVYEMIDAVSTSKKKKREFHLRELSDHPEAPFILAIGFAIRKKNWWKAEELSEYALWSCRARSPAPLDLAEVHFLNAFAKRFRLGSLTLSRTVPARPNLSGDNNVRTDVLTVASGLYNAALAHLNDYQDALSKMRSSQQRSLYEMRGRSEHAALCLFVAALEYFAGDPKSEDFNDNVKEYIAKADSEIEECRKIAGRVTLKELRTRRRAVYFQVMHNYMASAVFKFIISGDRPVLSKPELKLFREFASDSANASILNSDPLVRSEQGVFFALVDPVRSGERTELESLLYATQRQGIAVDREIASALIRRIDDVFAT